MFIYAFSVMDCKQVTSIKMTNGSKIVKPKYMKLNFGSGNLIKEGFVNADIVNYKGVDKVFDFNKYPYPFKENTFDYIYCSHILEHLDDFHKVIMELHRISKSNAVIEIFTPYFFSTKYAGEPDHKIPFSYRSFDNYTAPRNVTFYNKWRLKHATNFGVGFPFKMIDKRYIFDKNPTIRWFGFFHNLAPMFYERFFPGILPPMEVYFKLQVLKLKDRT